MSILRALVALLALSCCALPARAEDEDPGAERVRRVVDLPRYRVPPAPVGPRLSVPTDLIAQTGDVNDVANWLLDQVYENGTWLPFAEPPMADWALSLDNAAELLRALSHVDERDESAVDFGTDRDGLLLEGRRTDVERCLARVPWMLGALAPSVRVQAVLTATPEGEPERLRAMGRVTLWPNRWTRVYLQENAVPCTVHWDIEVAQEATTMDPVPVAVPEGQELYLRYHPGQGLALVEVWAGETDHVQIVRQDLSEVRNIPEANGPGVLTYPETAVNRVFTALLLPSGKAARREVRWSNAGVLTRLALDFEAPPVALRPASRGERNSMASLRLGAVADELEFDTREDLSGEWEDRLSRLCYEAGEAFERRGRSFDFSISNIGSGSIFLLEAPAAALPRVRAAVEEAESRLGTRQVSLRVLTVPEPAFRRALRDGAVGIGRALTAESWSAFREAGATTGESISTRALMNMRVGFRVGHTVPGVTDFNSEIAQASAGLHPLTSVRFAGLLGEVRVRKTTAGHALRVSGRISWADRRAGVLEMVFRPPVGMSGAAREGGKTQGESRRAKLPILGGGSAPVDTEIEIPGKSTEEHVVHAHVRGGEVVLLTAVVR